MVRHLMEDELEVVMMFGLDVVESLQKQRYCKHSDSFLTYIKKRAIRLKLGKKTFIKMGKYV